MSRHEIRRLSVAFNLADPDQAILYRHACKRTNVSAYIKRLIQRDIEGGSHAPKGQGQTEKPPVPLNEGLMRGLI